MWIPEEPGDIMKNRILFIAIALSSVAFAQGSYQYHYAFNFSGDANYTISNVYILEDRVAPDYSYSYGFRLPGDQLSAPSGGTVSDYANILTAPATQTLILAVTSAMPGDATGQQHVLIGMDNTAASYAANIAWGTLFRNTLEDDIIYDLNNFVNPDQSVTDSALQGLVNFAFGDATTGILDNLAQSQSAWFTPSQNSSFTLMTWSNGTVVGSGMTTFQSTPEPAPIAALGLGMVALLASRRRSR
jgi:hypothetical protein